MLAYVRVKFCQKNAFTSSCYLFTQRLQHGFRQCRAAAKTQIEGNSFLVFFCTILLVMRGCEPASLAMYYSVAILIGNIQFVPL